MRASEAFRVQGRACAELGSPLYAALLARLADDIDAGGPTAAVLDGHADDPGPSALALRLLGSVHRLVLERRAGALATYYPSVGGVWDDGAGTQAFLALLEQEPAAVREWLDRAPQTNEVGRAAALYGGLCLLPEALRLPVRLCEIGASGGLNLLADRLAYVDADGVVHGDADSPVRLAPAWRGPSPPDWPDLRVVERSGCDVNPVDASTTEGRLTLTAYVWPDQQARIERLRGALSLVQQHPPDVRRQGAGDFVDGIDLRAGTTTVLWHSVMWQYLPRAEQDRVRARIGQLAEAAGPESPFVHLSLEPTRPTPDSEHRFLVVLESWPGGGRRVLGAAAPHGLPVTWEPATGEPGSGAAGR